MRASWTPERREEQAAAMLGDGNLMRRPGVSVKNATARRGKKHPSIAGEKHPMWGKKHSLDALTRMSKSHMGQKCGDENPMRRPEVAAKVGAALKGRVYTQETLRKMSIAMKRRLADPSNHPMWRGGTSREPYAWEWNEDLKERIRHRDGYRCQWCGRIQEERGKKLDVHHIDYDKKNCDFTNLISLCRSCHPKTNTKSMKRQHWQFALERVVFPWHFV